MVVRRCVYCKCLIDPRKYYYLGARCTDICQECGDRLKAGLSPLEPQLHFMDLEDREDKKCPQGQASQWA
ncbi:MAG: hypothetical protein EOM02_10790 [Synergistales bacterium]|nr:hypothetical protein [Synergistales bacterium]